jgi:hypothetical protein
LELNIDQIRIKVEGDDFDEEEIAREISWHINRAFGRIADRGLLPETGGEDFGVLNLPVMDWEAETDKTAKIVSLILEALEEH